MNKLEQYFKVLRWSLSGRPFPPPHLIKQRMIMDALNQYKPRIMVETGTLLGDMVEAMKQRFQRIYSIEISPELARKAQQRFAGDSHVEIIENDSAIALRELVPTLHEPTLFWLDGHYSGGNTGKGEKETPIMEELETILSSAIPHVVMRAFLERKRTIPACPNWNNSFARTARMRISLPRMTASTSFRQFTDTEKPDQHNWHSALCLANSESSFSNLFQVF